MISPEMQRRGFAPASTTATTQHGAMLRPKPSRSPRRMLVSSVTSDNLPSFLGNLAPDERKALDFIAEYGDLIEVEGREPFLLIPTIPWLLDILAAANDGAEAEHDKAMHRYSNQDSWRRHVRDFNTELGCHHTCTGQGASRDLDRAFFSATFTFVARGPIGGCRKGRLRQHTHALRPIHSQRHANDECKRQQQKAKAPETGSDHSAII